jgi:cysteinyl-tRNA synthetase
VRSFPEYVALSGQKIDDVVQGEPDSDAKRDQRDFALWKAAKPGEPSWATPWGRGRPGWHLECSAMATMYLGSAFDVHGGGIDLIFPHHENEQAQSHAAGDPFTRFWLHNAWVTMAGEKMSKSLGNTLSIDALLRRVRGVELRFYLVAPHYRSSIEFSDAALSESVSAYRRIESFVHRVAERVGAPEPGMLCAEFVAAMDDDLGTPGALAAVHNTVREGNTALDAGDHRSALGAASSVRAMTAVLGLDPLDPQWERGDGSDTASTALSTLVDDLLAQRQEARSRRDFAAADDLRNRLTAAGIVVEDSPDGPTWSLKDA